MSKLSDRHYKEKQPEETVGQIQKILKNLEINVTEEWQKKSSIGTYALRLKIENTDIGVNGKGINKIYAQASAYAELIERFQNDLLGDLNVTALPSKYPFQLYYDEVFQSSKELVTNHNSYIDMYFSERKMNEAAADNKIKHFQQLQKLDEMYYGIHDRYLTIPYYSCREKRLVYLPRNVYRLSYGSNGMSAGNSFEEAMVQGMSEIIERYVQKKIIKERISLPDIPVEYIKKYPHIYEMFRKLEQKQEYKCWLKDCSLGGIYPVAAFIILKKNTGRYGIKLGCHPDYGIAMERALTEAAQGQDILLYSQRSPFDLYNKNVFDGMNIYNTYKTGAGKYPYHIFSPEPAYEFHETQSVEHMTNRDIMNDWCNKFIEKGYDIFIRDVSYLGFPSVHIIIPKISEMFEADDIRYRVYNTRFYVCELLKQPQNINKENVKYIIAVLEYFLPSVLENTIDTYYGWCNKDAIPCEKYGMGVIYLISMCYVVEENYKQAADYMKMILSQLENESGTYQADKQDIAFYKAVYHYLSGLDAGLEKEEIQYYISSFFYEELSTKVCRLFVNTEKIIACQYPEKKASDTEYDTEKLLGEIRDKLKKAQLSSKINQLDIQKKLEEKK